MIVFAHPDSLEEALATVQANVLDGMEVLVMEFISVLKSRATLVRKGEEKLSLGLVLADLCPRRIEIESGVLVFVDFEFRDIVDCDTVALHESRLQQTEECESSKSLFLWIHAMKRPRLFPLLQSHTIRECYY